MRQIGGADRQRVTSGACLRETHPTDAYPPRWESALAHTGTLADTSQRRRGRQRAANPQSVQRQPDLRRPPCGSGSFS